MSDARLRERSRSHLKLDAASGGCGRTQAAISHKIVEWRAILRFCPMHRDFAGSTMGTPPNLRARARIGALAIFN
jgi:hypothetical protein